VSESNKNGTTVTDTNTKEEKNGGALKDIPQKKTDAEGEGGKDKEGPCGLPAKCVLQ